jgi:hypothetical protein
MRKRRFAPRTAKLVAAVAGERHQDRGQGHQQKEAPGGLDVRSKQQHDRRDQQLAAGHAHDRCYNANAEPDHDTGRQLRPQR